LESSRLKVIRFVVIQIVDLASFAPLVARVGRRGRAADLRPAGVDLLETADGPHVVAHERALEAVS
jgi:hypothetical protein